MADLKIRNLDDVVAGAFRARAKAKGVSLEEEGCRTLTALDRRRSRGAGAAGKDAARRRRRQAR
jgi:plasmid stability protein